MCTQVDIEQCNSGYAACWTSRSKVHHIKLNYLLNQ
jgi:hypothetical protein